MKYPREFFECCIEAWKKNLCDAFFLLLNISGQRVTVTKYILLSIWLDHLGLWKGLKEERSCFVLNISPAIFWFLEVISAYKQYLEDTAKELGAQGPDAKLFAHDIYHLEERIAAFTPPREDVENPVTTYNRISLRSLKTIASSVSPHTFEITEKNISYNSRLIKEIIIGPLF